MAHQPVMGQGLLVTRFHDHTHTPHSVGLLWTRDQPDVEPSTWHQTLIRIDRYPCNRRDPNLLSQQASGRRPTF